MNRKLKNNLTAWGLMLPALLFIIVFTVFPVIRSVYLSLMDYRFGMAEPRFVGLDNYIRLFQSDLFWKIMGNTLFFAVITLVPALVIGLGLAMIVNRESKLTGVLRTAFFYPVVMPMVAAASIWMFIYMANNGLWDQIVSFLNMGPKDVLSSPETVLPALAIMYVWKEAGYVMIFFLSGLQAISPEVLESAELDGATGWKLFRHVTFPLLGPTFLFISTVELTNVFKLVDHVIIMTEGAPNNASTMLLYYIYQTGFTNFDYGTSSALTVIMLLILLLVALPRFIAQDRQTYYH